MHKEIVILDQIYLETSENCKKNIYMLQPRLDESNSLNKNICQISLIKKRKILTQNFLVSLYYVRQTFKIFTITFVVDNNKDKCL